MEKYFGSWDSYDSFVDEFHRGPWNYETRQYDPRPELPPEFPKEHEVLIAIYTYEDYSGSAYVLYERDGTLYVYEAGHCSCNGLTENGFGGSETTWNALDMWIGSGYSPEFREALRKLIAEKRGQKLEDVVFDNEKS